jgi:hypothetical protein
LVRRKAVPTMNARTQPEQVMITGMDMSATEPPWVHGTPWEGTAQEKRRQSRSRHELTGQSGEKGRHGRVC